MQAAHKKTAAHHMDCHSLLLIGDHSVANGRLRRVHNIISPRKQNIPITLDYQDSTQRTNLPFGHPDQSSKVHHSVKLYPSRFTEQWPTSQLSHLKSCSRYSSTSPVTAPGTMPTPTKISSASSGPQRTSTTSLSQLLRPQNMLKQTNGAGDLTSSMQPTSYRMREG